MRIKHEYDIALDDALAAVYDNVNMRASMAAATERLENAVERARAAASEEASVMRQELQDQYVQQEQTALQVRI